MRIVHITDLHLRQALPGTAAIPERRSRLMPALLDRAIAQIRGLRPDVVVCTGDLLDYPTDTAGQEAARGAARRDLVTIARALRRAGCPYVVLPGNHDLPDLTWDVFGDALRDAVIGDLRFIAFDDVEGDGHVPRRTGSERARFQDALQDASGPPQVHVQHYLVWPERNEGYPHTYVDGDHLAERIVQSGLVRLVLSGHYHPGVAPERLGDTWFATAPAFCEAPHPFWVYDLDGADLRWRAVEMAVAPPADGP